MYGCGKRHAWVHAAMCVKRSRNGSEQELDDEANLIERFYTALEMNKS